MIMSMHPHAEGKLSCMSTSTKIHRTVDLVVCMCRTIPEPDRAGLSGS